MYEFHIQRRGQEGSERVIYIYLRVLHIVLIHQDAEEALVPFVNEELEIGLPSSDDTHNQAGEHGAEG